MLVVLWLGKEIVCLGAEVALRLGVLTGESVVGDEVRLTEKESSG